MFPFFIQIIELQKIEVKNKIKNKDSLVNHNLKYIFIDSSKINLWGYFTYLNYSSHSDISIDVNILYLIKYII